MKAPIGKDIIAIISASIYLILYCCLLQFETTRIAAVLMLFLSPVIVLWMVYTVLKYGSYNGAKLGKEEFGYADKNKEELGLF